MTPENRQRTAGRLRAFEAYPNGDRRGLRVRQTETTGPMPPAARPSRRSLGDPPMVNPTIAGKSSVDGPGGI